MTNNNGAARLVMIPLAKIRSTLKNPRTDLAQDTDMELQGLAASMGQPEDNRVVEPPVVEKVGDGIYCILAGERRIQAARLNGWDEILCIMRPQLDPATAHTLRLVENLHRKALHPLDKAAGLKIEWLYANAVAMGIEEQAQEILSREQTPLQALGQLTKLLVENGFFYKRPKVTWDTVLDKLGIELDMHSRKKLLQVLTVDDRVQEPLREIEITDAALRSLGRLEPEDQARLVDEMSENPNVARKMARISRVMREGVSVDAALAEIRGESDELDHGHDYVPAIDDNGDASDAVLALLEAANQVSGIAGSLAETTGGQLASLSSPWDEYALQAVQTITTALKPFK